MCLQSWGEYLSCQDHLSELCGPYHRHVVLLTVSRVSAGDALGGDGATVLQRAGIEGLPARTRGDVLLVAAGPACPLPRRDGRGQLLMPATITMLQSGHEEELVALRFSSLSFPWVGNHWVWSPQFFLSIIF